jgi:hypothetical protein
LKRNSVVKKNGETVLGLASIFHGASGDSNRILKREQHLYNKDVTVEFNPTAYNTEELFLKFIDEETVACTSIRLRREKNKSISS